MQTLEATSSFWGEPIHVYTRAQALQDGVLVDVSDTAREAGFRLPVAMTAAAWADAVAWSDADTVRQVPQDQSGRLWDVLFMACLAARRAANASLVGFDVLRVPRGGRAVEPRVLRLNMSITGGDSGEPVITILLPNED